ncbi:MAG: hypothetical protein GEV03_18850 [Streptosporangiales bacterium]|nr:hypothetical protein [Streptosporangiales bacterium]
MLGRAHREIHGDPASPQRNAALFAAAEARSDVPRLQALAPYLRAARPERIFDAELDMLVAAIRAATRQ